MNLQAISAITFAVADMKRSIEFYTRLGFTVKYGGASDPFTCLRCGEASVNLIASVGGPVRWWGRVIFRVDDADAQHRQITAAGLIAEPPRNGEWGERYFHLTDPDGHELSFAQKLED